MKIEYWAEYLHPGSFYPEETTKQLGGSTVTEALDNCPAGAFAFTIYEIVVREGELEDGEKIVDRKKRNQSKRYYPGATLKTLAEVEAMWPDHAILASNMRCNDWPVVVLTRRGDYQPINSGDQIL